MADKQLVLALFESEFAADSAAEAIKKWSKRHKKVKLDAVAVLVKEEDGKVKSYKVGKRKTRTGAVIGVVAGILSGGITIIGGAIGGAIIGAFFRKGLGLSKEEQARLAGELDNGKAAVGIVTNASKATAVSDKLTALGGTLTQ
ncbi:MAG: hypothetical protein KDI07_00655 [Anaerolineae bacterium]|nr:hypothetical protein [Anaerolineae bacterium]MCB0243611.1 hypothetical protein [Anaerolineae bacterium]MCB0247059.1 hypothetical protein [Anaerolineae bacterium]MCB9131918.1 hypothetical protein [Anaerolineales bacterium]HRX04581.1 hypothetical protein [Anaerolineae bacterium]